jgi:hypothetical protein
VAPACSAKLKKPRSSIGATVEATARRAVGDQHALERAEEAADVAHAGAQQDGIGLDEQAAEQRQAVPVVAFGKRAEHRRRLAGADRHGEHVVGAQQVDCLPRRAQLLPVGLVGGGHRAPV